MIKRLIDILLSVLLIIALLPIIALLSLLIKFTSKGPVLHLSKRIGQNNIEFTMPKFRTMLIETPQVATHLLGNSKSYLTPIGHILRKLSLDEIPQLISILKGDMSFIGPRPALYNQYDLIELRTKRNIHLIKPGLTGWAQINGRDEISIEEKVQKDEYYYNNFSLSLDLKIFLITVIKVLKSNNISH